MLGPNIERTPKLLIRMSLEVKHICFQFVEPSSRMQASLNSMNMEPLPFCVTEDVTVTHHVAGLSHSPCADSLVIIKEINMAAAILTI